MHADRNSGNTESADHTDRTDEQLAPYFYFDNGALRSVTGATSVLSVLPPLPLLLPLPLESITLRTFSGGFMFAVHSETHKSASIGWLRAAVLGANDGLISTSSLVVGVAAAQPDRASVVVAALAGLVAGALSMAAGEYVSVSSQSDTETADMAREQIELATQPGNELEELAGIYVSRGLSSELAKQVALELTAHDALGAHARDELGIYDLTRARPIQAALASAAAFAVGAALPVLFVFVAPTAILTPLVFGSTIVALGALGMLAAQLGGASLLRGAARVMFWGAIAMVSTALIGKLVGSPV